MRLFTLVFLTFIVTGCAVGNKYDYRSSNISLPVRTEEHKIVTLDVKDLRPYVLKGDKKSNFVGLQRGGFGNPFDVTTASGNSLVSDMSESIARALNSAGYNVLSSDKNKSEINMTEMQNKTVKTISLTINEWKSDIYMNITLHCDVILKIYEASGNLLAENRMKFDEPIGGGQITMKKNSEAISSEFAKRIGYLFNKKEIRDAL